MLPIQTFLVFLALLMALGCSQKAPPVPGGQNATQVIPKKIETHITHGDQKKGEASVTNLPTAEAGKTRAQLEEDGRWILHIDGEGAQKLFDATEVAAVEGKKTGLQYECIRNSSSDRCTVILSAADGSVKNLIPKEQLKKADATFKPDQDYVSRPNFVTIKAASNGMLAMLDVEGSTGEKIFNSMTVTQLQQDLPAAKVFNVDYEAGILKYGTNVLCYMRPLKSDPKQKHYWCYLYLGTDLGSVSLISLPKSS